MKRVFVLAAILIFASLAHAEDAVTVVGVGNRLCGAWTEARRGKGMLSDVFKGWVSGFLSGANSIISETAKIDTLKEMSERGDAEGLWSWTDTYCQAHPLNSIAQAADVLNAELIRRAGAKP